MSLDIRQFISDLESQGIHLYVESDDLKIKAPKGVLSPDTVRVIRQYKQDIMAQFQGDQPMRLSLFFFSNESNEPVEDKYGLLFEASRFADANGFCGVWTPERHFNPLGGLFPNPSLMASALAMVTQNLKLRAGSVVLPLQDPIRVAEEWAVVDQLSKGRVELSFASGWHANDFALAPLPNSYANRQGLMYENLEKVQKLWRGETLTRQDGNGQDIQIKTYPQPFQSDIPVWITAVSHLESYKKIARKGAHLLTCLLDQDMDELETKLKVYFQTFMQYHPHRTPEVAVFLHTYVGEDLAQVKAEVKAPFQNYLNQTLSLLGKLSQSAGLNFNPDQFTEADKTALLDFAFERYFQERSLMGDLPKAQATLKKLSKIGVTEVACLVDFGLPSERVMHGLKFLAQLPPFSAHD